MSSSEEMCDGGCNFLSTLLCCLLALLKHGEGGAEGGQKDFSDHGFVKRCNYFGFYGGRARVPPAGAMMQRGRKKNTWSVRPGCSGVSGSYPAKYAPGVARPCILLAHGNAFLFCRGASVRDLSVSGLSGLSSL